MPTYDRNTLTCDERCAAAARNTDGLRAAPRQLFGSAAGTIINMADRGRLAGKFVGHLRHSLFFLLNTAPRQLFSYAVFRVENEFSILALLMNP